MRIFDLEQWQDGRVLSIRFADRPKADVKYATIYGKTDFGEEALMPGDVISIPTPRGRGARVAYLVIALKVSLSRDDEYIGLTRQIGYESESNVIQEVNTFLYSLRNIVDFYKILLWRLTSK